MNRHGFAKLLIVAMTASSVLAFAGCGKFESSSDLLRDLPPTSSNPAQAEKTEIERGQNPANTLTEDERRALNEDMNGLPRTQSDDELVDEAERRARARAEEQALHQSPTPTPTPTAIPAPAPEIVPPTVNETQESDILPGEEVPSSAAPAQPQTAAPAPDQSNAPSQPPATARGESAAPAPSQAAPPQPTAPAPSHVAPPQTSSPSLPAPRASAPTQAEPRRSSQPAAPAPAPQRERPAAEPAPSQAAPPVPPRAAPQAQPQTPAQPVAPAAPSVAPSREQAAPAPRTNRESREVWDTDLCRAIDTASRRLEVDMAALNNDSSPLPIAMPVDYYRSLETLTRAQGITANPVQLKKNHFICVLLPIAVRMNTQVFRQRLEIIRLNRKSVAGTAWTTEESQWFVQIKRDYNLDQLATTANLLERVDIIPLPLLLAQASEESGWGTSRATKEANNLFGMHGRMGSANCMAVRANANVCLRRFATVGEGVAAYIEYMNTASPQFLIHFRAMRGQMRSESRKLDSMELVGTLTGYSERGQAYIAAIRQRMSEHNQLLKYEYHEASAPSAPPAAGSSAVPPQASGASGVQSPAAAISGSVSGGASSAADAANAVTRSLNLPPGDSGAQLTPAAIPPAPLRPSSTDNDAFFI